MLLNSLGVKIDPREVEGMFTWIKSEIPKVVKVVLESVKRIETKQDKQQATLDLIMASLNKPDDPNVKPAGVGANGVNYETAHAARFGKLVESNMATDGVSVTKFARD